MDKLGKYEIIEQLGSGGMGVVYLAQDPVLGRKVAIKVIDDKMVAQPEMRERFYREARASGRLSHQNLTIVHDVGEVEGKPYIVMEYLKGKDLRAMISEHEPLRLDQKLDYALQICRGLEAVHSEDIIHRDIKPENVKILAGGKVKIMDFGIAKPAASTMTQPGARMGTPWYMSPEQIKGKGIDKRADIFSFGVLFYELLTYEKPFDGDDTTVLYKIMHEEPEPLALKDGALNDDLQAVINICLAKQAGNRYANFSEMIPELERLLALAQKEQKVKALLAEAKTLTLKQNFTEAVARYDAVLALEGAHAEAKTLKQDCLEKERETKTMKNFSGQMTGETISHYRVLERLGAGGMGVVYKAEDTRLKRFVALKFLPPELTRNEEAKRRFIREAQAASALDHPNICTVHGIEETENGQLFICMAHYTGGTLRKKISEDKPDIAECLALAGQIAQGLIAAHANGIVHRDLKPANIILTKDGVVKIVDFGLAKLAGATRLTKTGASMGTLSYMSPEQVKGQEVDHRSDVWSFGVILYEMLTGKSPFQAEQELALLYAIANEKPAPFPKLVPAIPIELERLVEKAMQKEAAKRFGSMRELHEALVKIPLQTAKPKAPAISDEGSEIHSLTTKGKTYLERREYNDAIARFKAVLEIDPANQQVRALLAECERRQEEQQQIRGLLAAGKEFFAKGEYQQALNNFEAILALDPNHAEANDFMAKLQQISAQAEMIDKLLVEAEFYLKREKFEQAIEIYTRILGLDPANKNASRGLQKAQRSMEAAPAKLTTPKPRLTTPFKTAKTPAKSGWKIGLAVATVIIVALGIWQLFFYPGEAEKEADFSGPVAAAKQKLDVAKTEADAIGAKIWAEEIYRQAEKAEQTGNTATDYAAAQKAYEQAAAMYANSKIEAQKNSALAETESDLEKLRNVALTAQRVMRQEKSAAEKIGSKKFAAALFEAAQTKEDEAERYLAADGKDNLLAAGKSYAEARAGYKSAREETERIAKNFTAKEGAETARNNMLAAKRQVSGSAEELNSNSQYARAIASENDGQRQFQAEDFNPAQTAFRQAQNFYEEAANSLAKIKASRQADIAKNAMLEAKAKIEPDNRTAAKYQEGAKNEQDGNAAYNAGDFSGATERYQTAQKAYVAAAGEGGNKLAKELERQENARREIQSLIAQYKSSFENRDFQALKTVLGNGFNKEDEAWADFLTSKKWQDITVEIKQQKFQLTGSKAELQLSIRLDYKDFKGTKQRPVNLQENWQLEEINGRWVVISH